MSVLDAFLATWSSARDTFGSGVPQTGEQFDHSARLQALNAAVHTARPGQLWSGGAATAYDGKNAAHARVIGRAAQLDRQLGSCVTESAQVVSTGRQNLESVKSWVLAAAQSVPPGPRGEQMLVPIVQKGLARVTDVVMTSNTRLHEIGGRIQLVNQEYLKLGRGEGEQGPASGDVTSS